MYTVEQLKEMSESELKKVKDEIIEKIKKLDAESKEYEELKGPLMFLGISH
ncbi:MAG: hypothetical protein ACRC57_00065 [Sarcina sp.]